MAKPIQFVLLLLLACTTAGIFGALHNQLSYSIGPSYFHDFKFIQFAVAPDLQSRIGASLVGWRSSWWMGLLIGIPAFGLAMVLVPRQHTVLLCIGALFLALFCAVIGALTGILLGFVADDITVLKDAMASMPEDVGFRRAALMHEGSYRGAQIGGLIALWTIWRARRKLNQT